MKSMAILLLATATATRTPTPTSTWTPNAARYTATKIASFYTPTPWHQVPGPCVPHFRYARMDEGDPRTIYAFGGKTGEIRLNPRESYDAHYMAWMMNMARQSCDYYNREGRNP